MSRLCLLAAPLALLVLWEAIVLPLDTFTFRCWETLSVRKLKCAFPGPFYPNRTIARSEVGDLGRGTEFEVSRPVVWVTDDHGFRNRQTRGAADLDVIIVGDSFVAGTGLTQDDILPAVLEQHHGYRTAGYAPANFKHFSRDPRFTQALPKIVIVAVVERTFLALTEPGRSKPGLQQSASQWGTQQESLWCFLDRLVAPQLFYFVQARLRPDRHQPIVATDRSRMLFLSDQKPEASMTPEFQSQVHEKILQYHQWVTSQGSRFIFVPIPDKEYCYQQSLPSEHWPSLLPELIDALRRDGIEVVDVASMFRQAIADNPDELLFQLDDSHWNAEAVRLAAQLIATTIEKPAQTDREIPINAGRDETLRR